jgi:hypothetical protein
MKQLPTKLSELRKEVSILKTKIAPMSLPPSLDSQIISDFPEIFGEFQGKQFFGSVAGQSR